MTTQKVLNLGAVVLEQKLQSRVEISEDKVAEYAEAMEHGSEFPAVTVHFNGVNYYLSDGFHRYLATKRLGKAGIICDIIHGTFRDAVLYSTGVNSKHGLPRTIADKRKAVVTLLEDFEWSQWSNAEIARQCDVSGPFVKKVREEIEGVQDTIKYKSSTGKVVERKATTNKKEKPPEKVEQEQPAEPQYEDPRQELIETLTKENHELQDRLAVAAMEGTDEERNLAQQTIADLREQVRILEIELVAVKKSRDTFQNENNQMRKQITMLQKKLKAAE